MHDNPSRRSPDTNKPKTFDLSLFKTLCRVCRFDGGKDIGNKAGVRRALELMPFIPAHFEAIREQPWTADVRSNMGSAVWDTLNKYRTGLGLSTAKRVEWRLAVIVLRRGKPLTEGEAELLTLAAKSGADGFSTGLWDAPQGMAKVPVIQIVVAPGLSSQSKAGYTDREEGPDARLGEYAASPGGAVAVYRFFFKSCTDGQKVDGAFKKTMAPHRVPYAGTETYNVPPDVLFMALIDQCARCGVEPLAIQVMGD